MGCVISDFVKPRWIIASLQAKTKHATLEEISAHIHAQCPSIDEAELMQGLLEREAKASTGADLGLALPHATIQSADELVVCLARSHEGIEFGALDNQRSFLFFTLVNPAVPVVGQSSYLQAISAVCRLMRSPQVRSRLLVAQGAEEIYAVLAEEEASKLRA